MFSQKDKKAESLIWIIIWVFILSFVILWIWNLIWTSKDLVNRFEKSMDLDILTMNSYAIIDNLDLSSINDWEIFYLYKNIANKKYEIFIWEHNNQYKYVNKYWEKVNDPLNYKWDVYSRVFQVLKVNYNWEEKIAVKWEIKRLIN